MDGSCGWLAVRGRRIWLSIQLTLHCRTTRRFWAVRTITWVAGKVAGVVMFSHENTIIIAMANINLVFRVARNIYKLDSKKTLTI